MLLSFLDPLGEKLPLGASSLPATLWEDLLLSEPSSGEEGSNSCPEMLLSFLDPLGKSSPEVLLAFLDPLGKSPRKEPLIRK